MGALASAQVTAPLNGPATKRGAVFAFTHATVHPAPGEVLADATVLVSDDRIVAVGQRVSIPTDAIVQDLKGLHLWPGLIEPYADLGIPQQKAAKEEKPAGAHFWNPAIRASTQAQALYTYDTDKAKASPR
jgi:imidazolonepropionase-like amidohydrolase